MAAPKTLIIGLSGGIGSGKSTVARMFEEMGAIVIDADAIVREVQVPGSPALAEIAKTFGDCVLDASGALDRKALGDIVFRDPDARARLNAIVHPKAVALMLQRLQQTLETKPAMVLLDIPLLFEGRRSQTSSAGLIPFDATVLVWVPEQVQVERQIARDGCDEAEARRRIAAQMPLDAKRALADYVIDNSGALEQTQKIVHRVVAQLLRAKN